MAEVYLKIPGMTGRNKKLTRFIATRPEVQRAVDEAAHAAVVRGNALLDERAHDRLEGAHRNRVSVDFQKGDVDAWVVLNAGRGNALAVEYGHDDKDGQPVEGLHILRDVFPRKKR